MASGIAQYRDFNLTLSGGEARKIVRDVSSMVSFSSTRPPTGEPTAIFAWELRFYHDTNYLTSIYLAESMDEDIFEFGDEQYGGDTGALKALPGQITEMTTPPTNSPEPPPIVVCVPAFAVDRLDGAAQLLSLGDYARIFLLGGNGSPSRMSI